MKLEDIYGLWEKDAKIDPAIAGLQSLQISEVHFKYYKIYIEEKARKNALTIQYNKLKEEKREFLTLGPTDETNAKGWTLPAQGKILKADAERYLLVDPDLVMLSTRLGVQDEKLDLLKAIMERLAKRSFDIKNYIEFTKLYHNEIG